MATNYYVCRKLQVFPPRIKKPMLSIRSDLSQPLSNLPWIKIQRYLLRQLPEISICQSCYRQNTVSNFKGGFGLGKLLNLILHLLRINPMPILLRLSKLRDCQIALFLVPIPR